MKISEIENKMKLGYSLQICDLGSIFWWTKEQKFIAHLCPTESDINATRTFPKLSDALKFLHTDASEITKDDFIEVGFSV